MNDRIILLLVAGMVLMGSVSAATLNMSLNGYYTDNAPPGSIDQPIFFQIEHPYLYVASAADDLFTILNISNPASITLVGNTTADTAPPYSLEDAQGFRIDKVRNISIHSTLTDDSLTLLNISNRRVPSTTGVGSTVARIVNPYSLENPYDLEYFKVGDNHLVAFGAAVDDTLTILNITNPATVTNVTYRWFASGTCTTDDLRYFAMDHERGILFADSFTDNYVIAINTSQFTSGVTDNITCMANYTDSADAGTIDDPSKMYFDNVTDLLYVTSYLDNGFTILNTSTGNQLTLVGTYYNTTAQGSPAYRAQDIAAIEKDGQRYVFVISQGNGTTTANGVHAKVSVFNATDASAIKHILSIQPNISTCTHILGQNLEIDKANEMLYYSTSNDDCLYAVKIFNEEEEPPVSTCTYSGSGNWVITDRCVISSDVNVCPNKIVVNTTGQLNLTSNAKLTTSLFQFYPTNTGMVRLGLSKGRLAKC